MFTFPRLEFDDAAHALRAEVRAFLTDERASGGFTPQADCWVSAADPGFSRKLGERGWLGMTWPREYGGHERPFAHRFVVTEELLAAGAPVAAHPECPPTIIDHADYVGSTSGILKFAESFEGDTLIVATEPHIMHQMEKALPNKTFIGAPGADGNCSCNICPYMALNTMEKMYTALRDLSPQIEIEEPIRLKAKKSLDRMLEMASGTVGMGDLGKVPFSAD